MIYKIILFFLIGMAVLAMFGKMRVPGAKTLKRIGARAPKKCKRCGRYQLTQAPCACKDKG